MKETTEQLKIDQFIGLFRRFEELKQSHARKFIDELTTFLPRFVEVQKDAELMGRKSAPDFNIFRFLDYERQELFHSRFISYLLNPRENHQQGHLFLEYLIEFLRSNNLQCKNDLLPLPEEDIHQGIWMIQREVFSKYGRLDIVIRNKKMRVMYVIENKVDAKEQTDQLERYGSYLSNHVKEYQIQGLLYLTINGDDPTTAGETPYYKISYKKHIQNWLEMVLPKIEAMTVRETVRQYISLISAI